MRVQDTPAGILQQALTQIFEQSDESAEAALPGLPIQVPLNITASGAYTWDPQLPIAQPAGSQIKLEDAGPADAQDLILPFVSERLHLDIDGRYPLMVASGSIRRFLTEEINWIARLRPGSAPNQYQGAIWNKDGNLASFPYTNVDIVVQTSPFPSLRKATVTFSGGGAAKRVRAYQFNSAYFRPVEFEFDATPDAKPVQAIQTHAHPNRPASLPSESLSIQKVFQRAGFNVTTSPGASVVPLAGAGANGQWSDMEMHDAMQVYWSRFANKSQWALWTFFAAQHEQGSSLGGIMFDDIGPNHRQGTAIFTNSFITQAPAGDANPAAWVNRMVFWTACHEMGHAFNLAHSWQKALGTPWIPLANDPEARSFMNYPYNVAGGQTAFFNNFQFRFSDAELLFLRHAPHRYVQMGNAAWFDHHGFEHAAVSQEPTFKLEARVNRAKADFEFMEPIVLDLKLSNATQQPQIIDEKVLLTLEHMTVIIKKEGREARVFSPFARYFWEEKKQVLLPGQATYQSLFISAGQNGWDISEPGRYTIQMCLHLGKEDIVSPPLKLRVAPPRNYDEEYLAQDFFTEDVGRILRFDGSRVLREGVDTLRELAQRLPESRAALHGKVALASALVRDAKSLDMSHLPDGPVAQRDANATLTLQRADFGAGSKLFADALLGRPQLAAETLSHFDYHYYVDRYSDALAGQGLRREAGEATATLYQTLQSRKVIQPVLESIKAREREFKAGGD
ncbi:hypothetical protein [Pseudoduganella namucuonensis]|uniref:Uncharacterized protein n=1 Tax=Pseudoduganella namucuonensis TaxID=1035707 RepID=A0A1I7GYY4_9BURK|nr:hypothetical protein [Pseudoduganella namucuonensis]SFU53671.1 hypothetical protein SAMN05216552_1004207 [Pseudoduganella namucuonensis]